MNTLWQNGMQKTGGDHLQQVKALQQGSVLCRLGSFSLIRVEGEEAAAFLQGQLSSDVRELSASQAQYSSYSSAKGRMLASFLVWMHEGAYYLMVAADIAEAVCKRLSMFVLRAKVKIAVADADWILLGLAGAAVSGYLPGAAEQAALRVAADGQSVRVALPGGGFVLALRGGADLAGRLLSATELTAIAPEAWALRDIDAGIAWVTRATQEQFVPQMANMELIGAVSFKKGCYPGQEIVARTQYLGKLKRRLFKVALSTPVEIGAKLYCPDTPGQAIGMIAALCQVADDRYEGLAVAQISAWENGIFLEEDHATALEKLELPYSLAE